MRAEPRRQSDEHHADRHHATPWRTTVGESAGGEVPLAADEGLTLRHHVGRVRLQPGAPGALRWRAEKRASALTRSGAEGLLRRLRLEVERSADGVRLGSGIEGSDLGRPLDMLRRGAVDLWLRVPPGARLDLRSVDGDLEVDRVDGPLEARSTNGDLWLRADAPTAAVRLSSTNGDVEVALGTAAGAAVEASSRNGRVVVEPPLGPGATARGEPQRVEVGGGGPELSLRSVNGDVRLRPLAAGDDERSDKEEA